MFSSYSPDQASGLLRRFKRRKRYDQMEAVFADIHSHLVPGVDDGSRDEAMSRALLEQAEAEGIRLLIATPHNYPDYSEDSIGRVKEQFALLKELNAKIHSPLQLYLGNEVYYRDAIIEDLEDGRALTMAGTRYVLTEFHPIDSQDRVMRGIRRVTEGHYRPIVAHVERIESFAGDPQALSYLRDMGARLQVNAHTMTGGLLDRRSRFWRNMAAEGLITFLGSDAHHPSHRPVIMRDAYLKLKKTMDEAQLSRLFYENAQAMLDDKII